MLARIRTPHGRTLLGGVLALLIVPVVLGITACLKTPIGDPEQGWVDPRVTGIWMPCADSADQRAPVFWLVEPYDRRTWLLTWIGIEVKSSDEATGDSTPEPDHLQRLRLLKNQAIDDHEIYLFKSWLTSIGDRRFLVLEPRIEVSSERGFRPHVWLVYHVVLHGDRMQLVFVGGDLFDKAGTRAEAERIIADHLQDPEIYSEERTILCRLPQAAYADVREILNKIGIESLGDPSK